MGPERATEVLATFEGSQRAGVAYVNSKETVANLESKQQALQGVEPKLATSEELDTARAEVKTSQENLTTAQHHQRTACNRTARGRNRRAD